MKPELKDLSGLFRLDGKVAVVTGGGGILGRHFCVGLAQHGARVVCCDLDLGQATAFCKQAKEEFGLEMEPRELDVANRESVQDLVADVRKAYGQIDILHNNAAAKSGNLKKFFADFEDFSLETWREIMAVNIDGMFLMAQAVGKEMARQKSGGSIVQTSSVYGIWAPDQRIYKGAEYEGVSINSPAVYSASKAAVIGLSKYLASYWAEKNIRVNTISPGGVESGQNETFKQNYSARIPMNRMAQAHEMVGALVFLASSASSYITGQNIVVDGGLGAW